MCVLFDIFHIDKPTCTEAADKDVNSGEADVGAGTIGGEPTEAKPWHVFYVRLQRGLKNMHEQNEECHRKSFE